MPLPVLTRRLGRRRGWALLIQALLALRAPRARRQPIRRARRLPTALCGARRRVPLGEPGHRHRRLSRRAAAPSASRAPVRRRRRSAIASAWSPRAPARSTSPHYFGWFARLCGDGGAASSSAWPWCCDARAACAGGAAPRAVARECGGRALRRFPRRTALAAILVFVVLYKFGDALAGVMSGPFYIELGFSQDRDRQHRQGVRRRRRASPACCSAAGVVYRSGLMRALLLCGSLQMLSNLMYVVQLWAGHDPTMLARHDRGRERHRRHGLGGFRRLSLAASAARPSPRRNTRCCRRSPRRRAPCSPRRAGCSPTGSAGRRSSCWRPPPACPGSRCWPG